MSTNRQSHCYLILCHDELLFNLSGSFYKTAWTLNWSKHRLSRIYCQGSTIYWYPRVSFRDFLNFYFYICFKCEILWLANHGVCWPWSRLSSLTACTVADQWLTFFQLQLTNWQMQWKWVAYVQCKLKGKPQPHTATTICKLAGYKGTPWPNCQLNI